MIDVGSNGKIMNGYFVLNVTLDMKNQSCSTLQISVFDSFSGSMSNVSIIGNITVINLDLTLFDATMPIMLSRFFGSVNLLSSQL